MSRTSNILTLKFLIGASLLAPACSSREQNDTSKSTPPAVSASSSASIAAAPAGPIVRCLDLPKASRFSLRASVDGKTMYYVMRDEPKDAVAALDQDVTRYSLYALDVATKTEKKLVEDMGIEFAVTKDGHIVFVRYDKGSAGGESTRRMYSTTGSSGEAPKLITPKEIFVSSFYVNVAESKVIYADTAEMYEVAAAGGEHKKMGPANRIAGGSPEGVLVERVPEGFHFVPHDGGKPRSIPIPYVHRVVGLSNDVVISRRIRGDARFFLTSLEATANTGVVDAGTDAAADAGVDGGAANMPSLGTEHDVITLIPSGNVVYSSTKKDEERTISEIRAKDQKPLLKIKGIDLAGLVALGTDTFGALACQDTHWDESCGDLDEVDVCIIERAPAGSNMDIPIRKTPAVLESIAGKLAPMLEENDLKGAKTGFKRVVGDNYRFHIESPAEGPTELAALHARVRALTVRVTELSGMATLDVHVDYANGYVAESRFMPKQKRFVTFAGIGTGLVADSNDYTLEVDPKVILGGSTSTCTGSVKNTGQTPLENLEVVCSIGSPYEKSNVVARGKTKPTTIAPGAEAKYTTVAFPHYAYGEEKVRLTVLRGEEELLFANRYAKKEALELFEAAAKMLPTTGLAFAYSTAHEGDYVLHVVMTEKFEQQGLEKQIESCTNLTKAFAKIAFPLAVLPQDVSVHIYDPTKKRPKFTFEKGKIEPAKDTGRRRL